MRLIAKIIATVFGIGFAPLAPGTVASAAVVLLYKAALHRWPVGAQIALVAAVAAVGVWPRPGRRPPSGARTRGPSSSTRSPARWPPWSSARPTGRPF